MTDSENTYSTFKEMGLKKPIITGILKYGFKKPTINQQKAIVPIISGKDIIVHASSDTNKTSIISIGMLEVINFKVVPHCQAIILSPTIVLAEQTNKVVKSLGWQIGVKTHLCIGGKNIKTDIDVLKKGVHVMIGTPGRIMSLLERKVIDSSKIKILIIDELDRLLSCGFKDQMNQILEELSPEIQICVFSEIFLEETLQITNNFMQNPTLILLKKEEIITGITQYEIEI
jgi:translation initiation factor 4A